MIALVVALILRYFFIDGANTHEKFLNDINKRINVELVKVNEDIFKLRDKLLTTGDQVDFGELSIESVYPYYVYRDGEVIFWSDYSFVPAHDLLKEDFEYKYLNVPKGKYVVRKIYVEHAGGLYELVGLLPLFYDTKITNNYLKTGFNTDIFASSNLSIDQTFEVKGNEIYADNDYYLFSVIFEEGYKLRYGTIRVLVLILVFISILSFIIWVFEITKVLAQKSHAFQGLMFLAGSLVLVRALMLFFKFPFSVIAFDLFDSRYFASSILNPSLGDLMLNALVLFSCAQYLFKNYYKSRLFKKLLELKLRDKKIVSVALVTLSFFILAGLDSAFRTMYDNSQITFDITKSIDFSSFLRIVSLIIFFIYAITYFALSHVVFKVFIRLNKYDLKAALVYLVIGGLLFSLLGFFLGLHVVTICLLNIFYVTALITLKLPKYLIRINYLTFIYFFVGAIMSAIMGAHAIYNFEKLREFTNKQNLGTQLITERDIQGEFLLSDVIDKVKNDVFIELTFTNLFTPKDIIRQKIKRKHLSGYFDKYDVEIYLFDQQGRPIENTKPLENYTVFKNSLNREQNTTDYNDIFLIDQKGSDQVKKYLAFIPIRSTRNKRDAGYIVLDLQLKRVIPNSVYPKLLVDKAYSEITFSNDHAYGIFSGNQLTYSSGDYNYERDFDARQFTNDELFNEGIESQGFQHLGVKGEGGRFVIISTKPYPLKDVISNFSFLFLFLVFVILIIVIFYAMRFRLQGTNLNLATKIQLYLNFAFFIPLFIVSITTLSLINSSYNSEIKSQYWSKSVYLGENIANTLEDYVRNISNREVLSNKILEIAKYAELDINLFNVNGRLIASTQSLIFENGLFSNYINPQAVIDVLELKKGRVILNESVGSLAFKSSYYGVKSFETGEVLGILSIPFFESQSVRERQVIEILSNIMNTFSFIFIVFLILSFFASRFLTYPLHYITDKIKKISLSGHNTPMVWNSDDEIGLLVGEYNRMLVNLEESKEALARTEKESAWREMAKQVAHEIKNPLTPMKLNLQHLKRTLSADDSENAKNTDKSISNLLHQIDTLSDIATSFSSFAKMPLPKNERFELATAVRQSVNLYRNSHQGVISSFIETGEFYVIGDEKLIGRIINNLIINGIQSVPQGEDPEIKIYLRRNNNNKAIIEIKDNGAGIDESIIEKVFLPNFSTKDTGSGIGLAIAKRGIEHAGGTIWFETEQNKGTSFYIELPIID
ncbi:HAMP domain-containing sensor histidine kinase [Fulvivirgaceae bacterium BMA10]|uniref:histidine kinase n=1 Tax=Splendidivirga corallicola TaxID=3051826 RepID=A0ABT8KQ14_9BACT|nr:HAMP domain-containing sensor histidine kinase [Fulvivirgaceae bacterium BMA10]